SDALSRSIDWSTRRAVFWLASRAVTGRLPAGTCRPAVAWLSGDLLAYSGGPAPESHRLPVRHSGRTPDGCLCGVYEYPRPRTRTRTLRSLVPYRGRGDGK